VLGELLLREAEGDVEELVEDLLRLRVAFSRHEAMSARRPSGGLRGRGGGLLGRA